MTHARAERHVYLREITQEKRTSLSVLAGMIPPGSRVLDLGTGGGALGQYLSEHSGCIVDGVTINDAEAEVARPYYRRIEVANLEQPVWVTAFENDRFDIIVCADVLEHLRDAEPTLRACATLLAPSGRILLSIPNTAYCGLVAELLQGEFTYREEGLLDQTHLRFFTRRSLLKFLRRQGWTVDTIEPIELPLSESEFHVAFDKLPPAVARYLLAAPDAAVYQFVASAHLTLPQEDSAAMEPADGARDPVTAVFSAQLYVGHENAFDERSKVTATGVIGKERQVLRFSIPAAITPPTALRLDPADRPGFLHLYRITLLSANTVLWQWSGESEGLGVLETADHQDMLLRGPWISSAALVLLHGEDPRIVLPIAGDVLKACGPPAQAVLEVELGWPMSADYMALVQAVEPLRKETAAARKAAEAEAAAAWKAADAEVIAARKAARAEVERATRELEETSLEMNNVRLEAQADVERAVARMEQALEAAAKLRSGRHELEEQLIALREHQSRIIEEKNLLTRQKLALQADLRHLGALYDALGNHLRWIENSTVFRMTRPLVHAKMALERMAGKRPPKAHESAVAQAQPIEPLAEVVDVIVPVYRGLKDTQLCVRSVLASRCKAAWRLVLVNDASPQPELTEWLRETSKRDGRIVLLENQENLGFVATVNRAMALSEQNDVLLLNSDTEVSNDWLDRLRAAAYSDLRVATVTPFSNNATICSYPRFCEPNELPPGYNTARLDAVFASANPGQVVDVPTGVGFCMYIRRDCINEVGFFDVQNFGKGYGEENDFCRRAAQSGWRNLHALDTFVLHTGGVSFGDSKSDREREAVEKLRRMHPTYDGLIHEFVARDPARSARFAVDLGRVRAAGHPCVLAIVHDRAGGTQRHVAELAEHFRGRATFFTLVPTPGNSVLLELLEPGAGFRIEFSLPHDWQSLLQVLRGLGIVHLHYHHVLGQREEILGLGEQLGIQWDYTAHDYYSMCPQISLTDHTDRYCGEQGDGQCGRCLQRTPAPGGGDIATWRQRHGELLTKARHVLAPSRDTARRYARMWPAADVRVAPHTDLAGFSALATPLVVPPDPDAPLKVVVIGALSRIKGADLLEDVALLAAKAGAPVEFHLIGYAYRELRKQPRASLTVHGPYEEADLEGLLKWIQPDLVWFPALWPETYSYTLSACLIAGLPVVAPDIGSFPERLSGRPWSWVRPWNASAEDCLAFFREIREVNFATGQSPASPGPIVMGKVDAVIGSWSYDTDYLHEVFPMSAPVALDVNLLASKAAGHRQGAQRHRQQLKTWALSALVKLRSAPPLRRVVRAVPLRWQTRVKTWLRA